MQVLETYNSTDHWVQTNLFSSGVFDLAVQEVWEADRLDGEQDIDELQKVLDFKEAGRKYRTTGSEHGIFKVLPGSIVYASLFEESASVTLYSNDQAWIDYTKEALEAWAEEHKIKEEDGKVPITFSYLNVRGELNTRTRRVLCPTWDSIKLNYPCADAVSQLYLLERPYDKGKIVFWHGEPGNGKTYAIRSTIQAWKKKADFIYVMDPEKFLNVPSYIFELLMSNCCSSDEADKFKVLILEDSLDYILKENRTNLGHTMSRLLNLTDGFIGQGLNLILILTTNEEMKEIDPAFTRPGRCLQVQKFRALNEDEAQAWCNANKAELPESEKGEWSLAELYARVVQDDVVLSDPIMINGFGG